MEYREMLFQLKQIAKSLTNIHLAGGQNIFIFASPRSGSTWLMDLILTQPGFKPCADPFDLRDKAVKRVLGPLGLLEWTDFYDKDVEKAISMYISGFCSGRYHFKDPPFYRNYNRIVTRNLVFKILHAAKDRINWFRDNFRGKVIYLIRHPIAVSLSRKAYPRLMTCLQSSYRNNFSKEQLELAMKIVGKGSWLEQGVLDWCLENSVSLKQQEDDWIILSYEQLVLDPQTVLETFVQKLGTLQPQKMKARLQTPSSTVSLSDQKTQDIFSGKSNQPGNKNRWLVEKWRERVNPEKEGQVMKILEAFDITVYKNGNFLPSDEIWLRGSTK